MLSFVAALGQPELVASLQKPHLSGHDAPHTSLSRFEKGRPQTDQWLPWSGCFVTSQQPTRQETALRLFTPHNWRLNLLALRGLHLRHRSADLVT